MHFARRQGVDLGLLSAVLDDSLQRFAAIEALGLGPEDMAAVIRAPEAGAC